MQENRFIIRKNSPTVSKTFRISVEIAEILEKLAQENNISVNSLVVQCIIFALENRQEDSFPS